MTRLYYYRVFRELSKLNHCHKGDEIHENTISR
jgi:hypothetical protein